MLIRANSISSWVTGWGKGERHMKYWTLSQLGIFKGRNWEETENPWARAWQCTKELSPHFRAHCKACIRVGGPHSCCDVSKPRCEWRTLVCSPTLLRLPFQGNTEHSFWFLLFLLVTVIDQAWLLMLSRTLASNIWNNSWALFQSSVLHCKSSSSPLVTEFFPRTSLIITRLGDGWFHCLLAFQHLYCSVDDIPSQW